jgi:phytoene dehydrogenase-like protein
LVVSAADGYSTIFNMLQGKYVNDSINSYYKACPKKQVFGLESWYGIAKNLSKEPHAIVLFLDQPITVEGKERDRLDIEIFNFDPLLAPTGKTVIKVVMESDYDYWKELSLNPNRYLEEKQKVSDLIGEKLEKRFPGLKSQIEATDVVTPVSVEHWTSAYHGYQTWGAPKEYAKEINKNGVSKILPGLHNFYMVGQWSVGIV